MSNPTVTVIIATYNKSKVIPYTIQSVLQQSYEDFELRVIGDACTDDTERVVNSFQDSRVFWHNLAENSGYQSRPHNEGLRRARGRLIAYLNHDDLWFPNHLEVLVDTIERTEADLAYTILEWIVPWGTDYPDIPHFPQAATPPEASALMHHKNLVDEVGYWRDPHEVYSIPRADFLRRAQFAGKHFEFAPFLTVLKFAVGGEYSKVGLQSHYLQRMSDDPVLAHRRLGVLLANASRELESPVSPKRFCRQLLNSARRKLIGYSIDPARLRFWHRPGKGIRQWRREHGLDS